MSRVQGTKQFIRPTRKRQADPGELPGLLERIDASVFSGAEVDAIERLMNDAIETLMTRGMARPQASSHTKALPARHHRDSNR